MDLKRLGDFWVPNSDAFLEGHTTLHPEQVEICKLCLSDTKCFVDVGANVGYWTKYFSGYFETVYSYEPDDINFECLEKNVVGLDNVTIFKCALGEHMGFGYIRDENPENCGMKHLNPSPIFNSFSNKVDIKPLDSVDFEYVNLLKVDTEGYDLGVLMGAEKTILRCNPIIVVEYAPNEYPQAARAKQYGYPYEEIPKYLEGLGMYQIYEAYMDLIYGWKI